MRNILGLLFRNTFAFDFVPGWLEPWLNYPGLELWKFVNLIVFILCALYLHRRFGRPIREALRSRSEGIKRELETARQERDQALAKLTEVEAVLSNLDSEVAKIKESATIEAEAEKHRLSLATDQEVVKIREQAKREIESYGKIARQNLRRFAASESVRLAEEILKREMRPEDDARLTDLNVQQLGGRRA
ncbi:MAG TPA: ATP synthase F0 subunit B [Pyrinomonadaceae bacterium]|nr:ATP synthase F0 subunit B [Pyrinomonadaceae bacterium]